MPKLLTDPVTGKAKRYYSRRECGLPRRSTAPKGAWKRRHRIRHHGVGRGANLTLSEAMAVWRGYWRYHVKTKGWSDIGYSVGAADATDVDGAVLEGRGWGRDGGHTVGRNHDGYADCYIGDGRYSGGTDGCWEATRAWVAHGQAEGAFGDDVEHSPHDRWQRKECPGSEQKRRLWESVGLQPEEEDMALTQQDKEDIAAEVWRYLLGPDGHTQPAGNRLFDCDVHADRAARHGDAINNKVDRLSTLLREGVRAIAAKLGLPVKEQPPDRVDA